MRGDTMQIITNHHEREVVYHWELTDSERKWFDWDGAEDCNYVRYKGNVVCISEFMSTRPSMWGPGIPSLAAWDGYQSDSFFSGLLVKYCDDTDFVVMGWYMS